MTCRVAQKGGDVGHAPRIDLPEKTPRLAQGGQGFILGDCTGKGLFGQFLSIACTHERQVEVAWARQREQALKQDLPRRVAEQIVTAHHVRNALLCIVNHDRKRVAKATVRTA